MAVKERILQTVARLDSMKGKAGKLHGERGTAGSIITEGAVWIHGDLRRPRLMNVCGGAYPNEN